MAKGDIKTILDEDIRSFLMDTRMPFCLATKCEHNGMNLKGPPGKGLICTLKAVDLDDNGKCKMFKEYNNGKTHIVRKRI